MIKTYICNSLRTPIGKTGGCFKSLPVEALAAQLIEGILGRAKIPVSAIEKILLANTVGQGGNIANFSGLSALGLTCPPAVTLDYQCGGSLMALELGMSLVASGMHDVVLVGGAESTSLEPVKYLHGSDPKCEHYPAPLKRAPFTPLSLKDQDMLTGAENTARLLGVERKTLDEIALYSHQRAADENVCACLRERILPVRAGGKEITADESIRKGMRMRLLERMPSLVMQEGLITAGNACLTHDGAAGMLIASEAAIKALGLVPEAEILCSKTVRVNPSFSPLGALSAVKGILKSMDLPAEDVDYYEVNEAFAVKTYSLMRHLNLPREKVNPLGGTLAYGHPYGATGALLITHLVSAMKSGETGIAAMGVAGGLGIATAIRRV